MERGCHRIPAKTKMASGPASSRDTQNRVQELCEHREVVMLSVHGERSVSIQIDPLLAYWWSLDPSKNKMFQIQLLPTIPRTEFRSCMNTEVVLGSCGEVDRLLALLWSLDPNSNKMASDPASSRHAEDRAQ